MNKKIQVKCPKCNSEFSYYERDTRPFCSERCKMVDLGHWFEGSYAFAGKDGEAQLQLPEEESDDEQYYY